MKMKIIIPIEFREKLLNIKKEKDLIKYLQEYENNLIMIIKN